MDVLVNFAIPVVGLYVELHDFRENDIVSRAIINQNYVFEILALNFHTFPPIIHNNQFYHLLRAR